MNAPWLTFPAWRNAFRKRDVEYPLTNSDFTWLATQTMKDS